MAGFSFPVRVYWEDTDAGGVVYYANYLKFLERARSEWLRTLGIDQVRLMRDERLQFVVVEANVRYHRPARFDDQLVVTVTLEWLRGFRAHVKQVHPAAMLVGEVWTATEIVSEYIDGGSLDLAFEFDVAKAILKAIESGRRDDLAYAERRRHLRSTGRFPG